MPYMATVNLDLHNQVTVASSAQVAVGDDDGGQGSTSLGPRPYCVAVHGGGDDKAVPCCRLAVDR